MTKNKSPRGSVTLTHKQYDAAVKALTCYSTDCQMALCGGWDRSDDGFEASQQLADEALELLGIDPPVYTSTTEED